MSSARLQRFPSAPADRPSSPVASCIDPGAIVIDISSHACCLDSSAWHLVSVSGGDGYTVRDHNLVVSSSSLVSCCLYDSSWVLRLASSLAFRFASFSWERNLEFTSSRHFASSSSARLRDSSSALERIAASRLFRDSCTACSCVDGRLPRRLELPSVLRFMSKSLSSSSNGRLTSFSAKLWLPLSREHCEPLRFGTESSDCCGNCCSNVLLSSSIVEEAGNCTDANGLPILDVDALLLESY